MSQLDLRIIFVVMLFSSTVVARAQTAHTPKPGSAERQKICDGARAYVFSKYAARSLPRPIVFKIEHLAVTETFANFQAVPLWADGSYVDPSYLPDLVFNFCLRKTGSNWQVIVDLSRSDVPETSELGALRQSLPVDFPRSLLSPTWQKLLGN